MRTWAVFLMLGTFAVFAGGCQYRTPRALSQPVAAPSAGVFRGAGADHVHLCLVNGLDPFNYAQLDEVGPWLEAKGLCQSHFFQMFEGPELEEHIRAVKRQNPRARVAVIGFSFGANVARDAVHVLKEEGIGIDLLVYLGGNTLNNDPRDRPTNVGRIVNILALGMFWNGARLDGADNIQLVDTFHFGLPMHPYTLQVLERELHALATR